LSSNGDDTNLERALFTETSIPELRRYCGGRNLDLSVIDFNYQPIELRSPLNQQQFWFRSDDKNSISELKLNAIRQCFAEGIGPCFLVSMSYK